jgi:hypothetical protein
MERRTRPRIHNNRSHIESLNNDVSQTYLANKYLNKKDLGNLASTSKHFEHNLSSLDVLKESRCMHTTKGGAACVENFLFNVNLGFECFEFCHAHLHLITGNLLDMIQHSIAKVQLKQKELLDYRAFEAILQCEDGKRIEFTTNSSFFWSVNGRSLQGHYGHNSLKTWFLENGKPLKSCQFVYIPVDERWGVNIEEVQSVTSEFNGHPVEIDVRNFYIDNSRLKFNVDFTRIIAPNTQHVDMEHNMEDLNMEEAD